MERHLTMTLSDHEADLLLDLCFDPGIRKIVEEHFGPDWSKVLQDLTRLLIGERP